jgi:hypothetical protein
MYNDLEKLLEKLIEQNERTQEQIDHIVNSTFQYKNDITTIAIKLDVLREDWQKISKIIHGDGLIDPLSSRMRIIEIKLKEMEEQVENLEVESRKNLEAERTKFQKILVAIIGGVFTIISSLFAWHIDLKK